MPPNQRSTLSGRGGRLVGNCGREAQREAWGREHVGCVLPGCGGRPTTSMPRLALLLSALVALNVAHLPGQHSFAPTIGVSVGYQSSDSDNFVYAFHLTVPLRDTWAKIEKKQN